MRITRPAPITPRLKVIILQQKQIFISIKKIPRAFLHQRRNYRRRWNDSETNKAWKRQSQKTLREGSALSRSLIRIPQASRTRLSHCGWAITAPPPLPTSLHPLLFSLSLSLRPHLLHPVSHICFFFPFIFTSVWSTLFCNNNTLHTHTHLCDPTVRNGHYTEVKPHLMVAIVTAPSQRSGLL